MKDQARAGLGQWLEERCREEKLSLRQAATKTGLSHSTIADIIKGVRPSAETIRKLAEAFGGDGHRSLVLEDKLLTLSGYRRQRPEADGLSEPLSRLLDKISEFSEPELQIMEYFADFISKTGRK